MALSDAREAAILDNLFTSTVYLRLLQGPAGSRVRGNGTFDAGVTEVSTGDYTPMSIPSSYWNAAIGGSPTIKTLPTVGHSPLSFSPSGTTWDLCAFAFTTNNSAITSANLIASDCFVDAGNNVLVHHVGNGELFQVTNIYPIIVRLGDPPNTANPT